MQNTWLDESQAEIKIAGRNTNNLRYADYATPVEESEEEIKSLLMRVKEESEKADMKLNIKKLKSNGILSHHFMANRRGKVEAVIDFICLGSKIAADSDCNHEIERCLLLGRKLRHT